MKNQFRAYLLLIGHVLLGLLVLIFVQQLRIRPAARTDIIFLAFFLLNIVYLPLFGLKQSFREYWSPRKMPSLLIGVSGGLLLAALPITAASMSGIQDACSIKAAGLTIRTIIGTFMITSWEELWFRSVILNYGERYIPKVNIVILMGLLFMLLHMMNPRISLARDGVMLFCAGALLTTLYFYFRNIWVPAGMHFGNNLFGAAVVSRFQPYTLFGSNGPIYTGAILIATIIFLILLVRLEQETQHSHTNERH